MNSGQALLEYILLILFVVGIAMKFVGDLTDESGSRIGNIAHTLSFNLSTGTCERDCFFQGYKNEQRN